MASLSATNTHNSPGWPYNIILVEGIPQALAAEPQALLAAPAALQLDAKAKTNKIATLPPPQRRIVVMTLGVQLCLRRFIEGQRITASEIARRLYIQPHHCGRGKGSRPAIDKGDVESICARYDNCEKQDPRQCHLRGCTGVRSEQQGTYHICTYYPNLHFHIPQ